MSIVTFPRAYRHPLPADAIPAGRERHAIVFPMKSKWAVMEMDDGGGSLTGGLSKAQAILHAVDLAIEYCGTFEVRNSPPDEDGAAA